MLIYQSRCFYHFQIRNQVVSNENNYRGGVEDTRLEAKVKAEDLIFEAKAKDFKMCPRGLHLW